MSAYNELIKNFDRIRAYMRDFYVYGFKSREEYNRKSARSYDDERRRVESWLGEHMGFVRTPEGKNVFLSIDSHTVTRNPLHRAWMTKSFTDGDITLHFILLDILHDPSVALPLPAILERMDRDYLATFDDPPVFDESTVRKKLKEYAEEGLVVMEKEGRKTLYRRAFDVTLAGAADALHFFSETLPCGVVGKFILRDVEDDSPPPFAFKHHYITDTMDSDVLAILFSAMQEGRFVTATNHRRSSPTPNVVSMVPLRVFISTQNGRQNLLAYQPNAKRIKCFRVDYLYGVQIGEVCPEFAEHRAMLDELEAHMWGVNCTGYGKRLEHVEFTVRIGLGEGYIVERLERERRCGTVKRLDATHYRFSADVYDTSELIPWIRTFICRIEQMNFSNRTAENQFKSDLHAMYRLYGLEGGEMP